MAHPPDSGAPADAPPSTPSDSPPGRRPIRPILFANLGLLGSALALLVFISTRPVGPADVGQTAVPGASIYALGSAGAGLQIGQPALDFVGRSGDAPIRLTDIDGLPVMLADLRGRPVWVVFWATWCTPCQRETPDLRAAFEAHQKDGLVLLAIDLQEPPDVVRDYVRKFGLTYRIGLDQTGAISETYGVFGLPTHYFIDRQGVIRDRNFGPLTREQMETRVGSIIEP